MSSPKAATVLININFHTLQEQVGITRTEVWGSELRFCTCTEGTAAAPNPLIIHMLPQAECKSCFDSILKVGSMQQVVCWGYPDNLLWSIIITSNMQLKHYCILFRQNRQEKHLCEMSVNLFIRILYSVFTWDVFCR